MVATGGVTGRSVDMEITADTQPKLSSAPAVGRVPALSASAAPAVTVNHARSAHFMASVTVFEPRLGGTGYFDPAHLFFRVRHLVARSALGKSAGRIADAVMKWPQTPKGSV